MYGIILLINERIQLNSLQSLYLINKFVKMVNVDEREDTIMKNKKIKGIMSFAVVLTTILVSTFSSLAVNADDKSSDEKNNNEMKYYIGTTFKAGNNSYSESQKIESDDIHFGWQLGQFYVSGFSQRIDEKGKPVFLKNVGDKVGLYFNLEQNINKLNGDEDLSIANDDNGSDTNLEVKKQDFKHGALIVRFTDFEHKVHKSTVYTDFLKAKVKKGANTQVELFEEGDYEVSLDYEIKDDGFLFMNSYPNYKITFKFSVRNGNCMVFPFDTKTKAELMNSAFTENGFYLDLAKSRYLNVMIKREVLVQDIKEFKEDTKDTRYNKPAKDGDEFTDEGIYTITVKNNYTKEETQKIIYVGSDEMLKAYVVTGLSLEEIDKRLAQGMVVNEQGQIIAKEVDEDSAIESTKNTAKSEKKSVDENRYFVVVAIGAVVILLVVVLLLKIRKTKRKNIFSQEETEKESDENETEL